MPANLTPEYLAAESRFKKARDTKARIEALEEMLRVIPKHKGTDHLRGDLKKKLSQLREEQQIQKKKGGVRKVDPGYLPSQGAGQVVLLGPSNSGKSSLVAALSRAEPEIASYPYTTHRPLPAIIMYQDVPIQLVDAPAIDPFVYQPWMNTLIRNADLGLVVLDPMAIGVLNTLEEIQMILAGGRVRLYGDVSRETESSAAATPHPLENELDDSELLARLEPGDVEMPVIVAVNKIDKEDDLRQFEALNELLGDKWPMLPISAQAGKGLDKLCEMMFRGLDVIRVYAKPPGKPPSTKEPILLPRGSTVRDMARSIHKDLAEKLRYARVWSSRHFDGQRIPHDAKLEDKDIVEITI